MPCSGLKSAHELDVLGVVQQIDRRRAVARAAGVVGDEADALALQRREALRAQHVEAGHDRLARRRRRQRAGRAEVASGPRR